MSYTYDKTTIVLPGNAGNEIHIRPKFHAETIIYVDSEDYITLMEKCQKFLHFDPNIKPYPFYKTPTKIISFLEALYIHDKDDVCYEFENGNCFDLRRANVSIYHRSHSFVKQNYDVLEYIPGHFQSFGRDASVMKNPIWKIRCQDGKISFLMFCEPSAFVELCEESLQRIREFEQSSIQFIERNEEEELEEEVEEVRPARKEEEKIEEEEKIDEEEDEGSFKRIHVRSSSSLSATRKLTFYQPLNGYISTAVYQKKNQPRKFLYMHQIITRFFGNGKGTNNLSVDHIDRNPLNNRLDNLRLVTREVQEQNKACNEKGGKRKRMYCAQELPEGITQSMMRKFVNYNSEIYDKQNNKTREFFRVEHPLLKKIWSSSKSNAVPILEKLAAANKVAEDLELGILPEVEVPKTPKYVSLKTMANGETFLVFDMKQKDGKRLNLRKKMPMNFNLEEQIEYFRAEIQRKYDGFTI